MGRPRTQQADFGFPFGAHNRVGRPGDGGAADRIVPGRDSFQALKKPSRGGGQIYAGRAHPDAGRLVAASLEHRFHNLNRARACPSPHPLSRSRIYPTSATNSDRTRVNPSSIVKKRGEGVNIVQASDHVCRHGSCILSPHWTGKPPSCATHLRLVPEYS
jgi:hypothetical protein